MRLPHSAPESVGIDPVAFGVSYNNRLSPLHLLLCFDDLSPCGVYPTGESLQRFNFKTQFKAFAAKLQPGTGCFHYQEVATPAAPDQKKSRRVGAFFVFFQSEYAHIKIAEFLWLTGRKADAVEL